MQRPIIHEEVDHRYHIYDKSRSYLLESRPNDCPIAKKYQGMIRFEMFSTIETRPNIAFVTSPRSLFAKNPSYFHIEAVKSIPNYLKGSKD